MTNDERVFVCFRWASAHPEDDSIVSAARSLSQRVDAEGGMVAAWLLPLLIAAFEPDSWQQAVELACDRAQALPLAIGIAASRGQLVDVAGRRVGFVVGPGIARSVALAKLAVQGEVLVEAQAEPYLRGALLASATLRGIADGLRTRGRRVDRAHPWRDPVDLGLGRLRAPEWIGSPRPAECGLGQGACSLLLSPRGFGGTRFLDEVVRAHGDLRSLRLRPGPFGEPLGSLRIGLSKVVASEGVAAGLTREHAGELETLLGGEAIDRECAVALIGAALEIGGDGVGQLIVLDEADAIDADTLEAVAAACNLLDVCVLARLVDPAGVPEPLAELARATELKLGQPSPQSATDLVQALVGGALEDRLAARFARRGGHAPTGIVQALALALEEGELVWAGDCFVARGRKRGRGRARGAAAWVTQRLARRSPDDRRLLEALAVLGGEAPLHELDALLGCRGMAAAEAALQRLLADGWLERSGPLLIALPSSSVGVAIRTALATDELVAWHRAAAEVLETLPEQMAKARAVVHRLLAGEPAAAAQLARTASASAQAAGLSDTARALSALAESGSAQRLIARRLLPEMLLAESIRAARSIQAPAQAGDRRLDELIRHFELEREDVDLGRVVAFWRARDFTSLDAFAAELRQNPSATALADRISALTLLARRRVGEALQMLRQSKAGVGDSDSAERSRAALALGIALAAAGRTTEALLEGLDSLARARDAEDTRGERACARFLAELCRGVGADYAAARWNLLGAG